MFIDRRNSGDREAWRSGRLQFLVASPIATIWCVLLAFCTSAQAAPGDLDPKYGHLGVVIPGHPVRSSELDREGRQIVTYDPPQTFSVGVKRLLPSGRTDRSFGFNGRAKVSIPGWKLSGQDVALDSSGRVLVSVDGVPDESPGRHLVVRLDPDGSMDESFSEDGIADAGPFTGGQISVDSEDRPLFLTRVAGSGAVGRLTESGEADSSFGSGGISSLENFAPDMFFRGILIGAGPNDSVLVAGVSGPDSLPPDAVAVKVEKLNSGGEVDTLFGVGGVSTVGPTTDHDPGAMAIGADGSVFVSTDRIRQLTSTGVLDENFDPGLETPDGVAAMDVDFQGRLVYAHEGSPGEGFADTTEIARIETDGRLDREFGTRGRTYIYRRAAGFDVGAPVPASSLAAGERSLVFSSPSAGIAQLKLRGQGSDADADGFRNDIDECKWLAASGHSGCPVIGRTVIINHRYKSGFRGNVVSPSPACKNEIRIQIWRVSPGPDEPFASPTVENGNWDVFKRVGPGMYYASAPRLDRGSRGICRAARSKPGSAD